MKNRDQPTMPALQALSLTDEASIVRNGEKGVGGGRKHEPFGGERDAHMLLKRLAGLLLSIVQTLTKRAALLVMVSILVFIVLRVVPQDPLASLLPADASAADAATMRHRLGLDLPIYTQYGHWLWAAVHGDFGASLATGDAVFPLLRNALPTTLEVVVLGLLFGGFSGVIGALLVFRFRGTAFEAGAEVVNSVAISVPDFLWALLGILTVGVAYQLLPFIGPIDSAMQIPSVTGFLLLDTLLAGRVDAFFNALLHLVLPCFAMGMGIAPPLMRILRSSLIEVYREEYVAAAYLRGRSDARILLGHALRNAALPAVAMLGMQAGTLVGGTLLIETIFGFPGIGSLMVNAVRGHDLPLIQALAVTYAVAVQLMNMLADAAQILLNPKLRTRR